MNEDHVHSPVAEVVLVLDVPVVWKHEIDAGLVLVTAVLLVQVTESLGGRQADQEVLVLLPVGQETDPARLEDSFVELRVKGNVGEDLPDYGFDPGIVGVRLYDQCEHLQGLGVDNNLALIYHSGM